MIEQTIDTIDRIMALIRDMGATVSKTINRIIKPMGAYLGQVIVRIKTETYIIAKVETSTKYKVEKTNGVYDTQKMISNDILYDKHINYKHLLEGIKVQTTIFKKEDIKDITNLLTQRQQKKGDKKFICNGKEFYIEKKTSPTQKAHEIIIEYQHQILKQEGNFLVLGGRKWLGWIHNSTSDIISIEYQKYNTVLITNMKLLQITFKVFGQNYINTYSDNYNVSYHSKYKHYYLARFVVIPRQRLIQDMILVKLCYLWGVKLEFDKEYLQPKKEYQPKKI